jgi:hypothetical protein
MASVVESRTMEGFMAMRGEEVRGFEPTAG